MNKKFSYKQNVINRIETEPDINNHENYTFSINQIKSEVNNLKKWFHIILVNGVKIQFQLDYGVETNILPLEFYKTLINKK